MINVSTIKNYTLFTASKTHSKLAANTSYKSNMKLVARHDELNIIHNLFDNYQLLPKKYLYKTFQYYIVHHIIDSLKYFIFTKPYKMENLPQSIKYYKIEEMVYKLNNLFKVDFCVDRIIDEIECYITYSKYNQRKSSKTKLLAKLDELFFDTHYLERGLVSAKIFYLTLQHIIEHKLGFANPIKIEKPELSIIQNLPNTLLCYKHNKMLSAMSNYLQEKLVA